MLCMLVTYTATSSAQWLQLGIFMESGVSLHAILPLGNIWVMSPWGCKREWLFSQFQSMVQGGTSPRSFSGSLVQVFAFLASALLPHSFALYAQALGSHLFLAALSLFFPIQGKKQIRISIAWSWVPLNLLSKSQTTALAWIPQRSECGGVYLWGLTLQNLYAWKNMSKEPALYSQYIISAWLYRACGGWGFCTFVFDVVWSRLVQSVALFLSRS